MAAKTPPHTVMRRHLNRLRTALARAGITADVKGTEWSRAVLHIPPGTEITCRTNPGDDHRWWFWLDDKPIAVADLLDAAVNAIRRAHTGRVAR